MWPNLQFPGDLVTFTKEILNGKLHFLCSWCAQKCTHKCTHNVSVFKINVPLCIKNKEVANRKLRLNFFSSLFVFLIWYRYLWHLNKYSLQYDVWNTTFLLTAMSLCLMFNKNKFWRHFRQFTRFFTREKQSMYLPQLH